MLRHILHTLNIYNMTNICICSVRPFHLAQIHCNKSNIYLSEVLKTLGPAALSMCIHVWDRLQNNMERGLQLLLIMLANNNKKKKRGSGNPGLTAQSWQKNYFSLQFSVDYMGKVRHQQL